MQKILFYKFKFYFLKNETSFFFNSMLLATHNSKSSALSFKNRFLSSKVKLSRKLINFFTFKGDSTTQLLIFFKFYLNFCRAVHGINFVASNVDPLYMLLRSSPDFLRLFLSNPLMSSFDHAYMLRCSDLIPNVKVILVRKKQKKQKKSKKLKKYTSEYRLIKPVVRLQTLNRWLASLIRIEDKKLQQSFYKLIPSVLIQPKNSKLYYLRQKIYSSFSFS